MKSNWFKLIRNFLVLALLCISSVGYLSAHGGEDHKKKKDDVEASPDHGHGGDNEHSHADAQAHQYDKLQSGQESGIPAALDEYPSLHPMVVHFPIVLLLLAALSQIAGLFVFRKELGFVAIALLLGGAIGSWIVGSLVHPHTAGLSPHASEVLERHEFWAELTTWLAFASLAGKCVSQFWFRQKKTVEILVLALCIGSAVAVATAGHFGAQLVHIEGVGPQGKFLESAQHEH